MVGTGDLYMADDMRPVLLDTISIGQCSGEGRGRLVHRLRVPSLLAHKSFVLDTESAHIVVPVSGVIGGVCVTHHLSYLSI